MVNVENIPRDRISLGSEVLLLDLENEEEIAYKLVTSEDADAAKGSISTASPIGRSLLGKQDGDTVAVQIPAGNRSFEVLSFTTIHENDSES